MTRPSVPEGYHTATPHLVVKDAENAIQFYEQAFGAKEVMRLTTADGKVAHAEIVIGDSTLMLADEFPDWGNLSPESLGGSPVRIHLYVEDVDAVARRAAAAGAKVLIPVDDQFYGDRAGRLADPFGHLWVVATRVQEMSPEEMQLRFEEFMKQQSGG